MRTATRAARLLIVLFSVWIMVSYTEVIAHNAKPNPNYHTNNFFKMMEVV